MCPTPFVELDEGPFCPHTVDLIRVYSMEFVCCFEISHLLILSTIHTFVFIAFYPHDVDSGVMHNHFFHVPSF